MISGARMKSRDTTQPTSERRRTGRVGLTVFEDRSNSQRFVGDGAAAVAHLRDCQREGGKALGPSRGSKDQPRTCRGLVWMQLAFVYAFEATTVSHSPRRPPHLTRRLLTTDILHPSSDTSLRTRHARLHPSSTTCASNRPVAASPFRPGFLHPEKVGTSGAIACAPHHTRPSIRRGYTQSFTEQQWTPRYVFSPISPRRLSCDAALKAAVDSQPSRARQGTAPQLQRRNTANLTTQWLRYTTTRQYHKHPSTREYPRAPDTSHQPAHRIPSFFHSRSRS